MEEMRICEEKVLGKLNAVSTAKRLASMVRLESVCREPCFYVGQELHDSNFGKREEIHRMKDVDRL